MATTDPSPAPASADERLTAVGLLFEVAHGLQQALAGQIAEHGLSTSEHEVLLRLHRSPGRRLRMTDLAAQVGLSASGTTRLVDRLQGRGLVDREACAEDRRVAYAQLTAAGAARVEAVLPGHLDLVDRWFTGVLLPAELEALTHALRVVRAEVHPGADAVSEVPAGVRSA